MKKAKNDMKVVVKAHKALNEYFALKAEIEKKYGIKFSDCVKEEKKAA